jgi:ubiquinol-cytochrome c reductase cytochrome b subunit
LGHADNYIKANPLVTPPHIVPEWYFLPFHAILRSVPDKLGGVVSMFLAIAILFILPAADRSTLVVSPKFSFFYEYVFWFFILNCGLLGLLGAMPVEEPYISVARISTFFYFSFFGLVFFFSKMENKLVKTLLLANKRSKI